VYWQEEDDWLCTVEFLPSDDPEDRFFAAAIVVYPKMPYVRRILYPSCTFVKIIFNFSFFATAWLFCLWALASAAGERWAGATTECAVAPPPLCRYRRTEGEP
jgi:hypothetical protein